MKLSLHVIMTRSSNIVIWKIKKNFASLLLKFKMIIHIQKNQMSNTFSFSFPSNGYCHVPHVNVKQRYLEPFYSQPIISKPFSAFVPFPILLFLKTICAYSISCNTFVHSSILCIYYSYTSILLAYYIYIYIYIFNVFACVNELILSLLLFIQWLFIIYILMQILLRRE